MKKIDEIANHLNAAFVARENVVQALLLALVAGVPALIVGPPGTAKTALVEGFHACVAAPRFAWLMSRYSTPDELFGPVSLSALREDRFERATTGKLPSAKMVFLDECFKANSATLNAQLGALNERKFENMAIDWCSWIGASNEYPDGIQPGTQSDGDSLLALWDRYVVRCEVGYVSDAEFADLMWRAAPMQPAPILHTDILALQASVAGVFFPENIREIFAALRADLATNGVRISDRKWKQAIRIVAASAVVRGRQTAKKSDFQSLVFTLWETPDQISKLRTALQSVCGGAFAVVATIEQEAEQIHTSIKSMPAGSNRQTKIFESINKIKAHTGALHNMEADFADDAEDLAEVMRGVARLSAINAELLRELSATLKAGAK